MKLGFLQMRCRFGEIKYNVKRAITLLSKVKDATVVLPELFNTGYLFKNKTELKSLAEKVKGGFTTTEMKNIAKKNNRNIIFGIAEKSGSKIYNSSVYVSSKGKIEVYQKIHLFDREKLFFTPGKSLKVVSSGNAKLGMMVCFDWMFPEVGRVLTLKGANILVHPANLVLPWGQSGMKMRSLENGVFSVTANRIGVEKRGAMSLTFTGGSQIVDPRGEVIVSAGDRSECLKVKQIDLHEAADKNITSTNHLLGDRHPSIYALISKSMSRKKS